MKRKRFVHYWPPVSGIYRSPVDSHKGPVTRLFFLLLAWTSYWTNNTIAIDLIRKDAHISVTDLYNFTETHTVHSKYARDYRLGVFCYIGYWM